MTDFVHLHVHSNYSFCRGASKIESLVDAALDRGMRALALTDTNGSTGWSGSCSARPNAACARSWAPSCAANGERAAVLWCATAKGMRPCAGSSRASTSIRDSA